MAGLLSTSPIICLHGFPQAWLCWTKQIPALLRAGRRAILRDRRGYSLSDVALSRRIARPSLDYCEDGNLIFLPDATYWVQREEVEEINHHLISFLFDTLSKQLVR